MTCWLGRPSTGLRDVQTFEGTGAAPGIVPAGCSASAVACQNATSSVGSYLATLLPRAKRQHRPVVRGRLAWAADSASVSASGALFGHLYL